MKMFILLLCLVLLFSCASIQETKEEYAVRKGKVLHLGIGIVTGMVVAIMGVRYYNSY